MADTTVGSGYDSLIGTRQSTVNPTVTEFYNKQSGQGFTDPNALSSFVNQSFQGTSTNPQNVFDVLKGQYTPVKVDVAPVINSTQLAQPPKTALDVQSLLAENRKLQEQYLSALNPSQQELGLQNQLNTLQNQARSTELNTQAGLNQIEDQAIPMQFITGQQAGLQRQANLALQTNAFQQQPLVQQLQLASQLRQAQQDRYNNLLQFGREDVNLAMQMEQAKKQEEAQARQLAFEYGVNKPFYNIGGTIYRTADGKAYSTPDQFFADGGARDWSNVQNIEPQEKPATNDIAEYQFAVKQGFKGTYLDYLRQKTSATTKITGGGGNISNPAVDSWVYLIQSGQAKITSVPAALKNAVAQALQKSPTGSAPSAYVQRQNELILGSIDTLMPLVGRMTTGIVGKYTSGVPNSPAYNFDSLLTTLKSQITNKTLAEMRAASKTGGALGQVSDYEGKKLESALGSLDIGQSPSQFKTQLQLIKDTITNWNNLTGQTGQSTDYTDGYTGTTSSGLGYTIIP